MGKKDDLNDFESGLCISETGDLLEFWGLQRMVQKGENTK